MHVFTTKLYDCENTLLGIPSIFTITELCTCCTVVNIERCLTPHASNTSAAFETGTAVSLPMHATCRWCWLVQRALQCFVCGIPQCSFVLLTNQLNLQCWREIRCSVLSYSRRMQHSQHARLQCWGAKLCCLVHWAIGGEQFRIFNNSSIAVSVKSMFLVTFASKYANKWVVSVANFTVSSAFYTAYCMCHNIDFFVHRFCQISSE